MKNERQLTMLLPISRPSSKENILISKAAATNSSSEKRHITIRQSLKEKGLVKKIK